MSTLHSIVRRVLLEADTQGSEPKEPSYWDEVSKEAGRWADAAAELVSDAASMAGTVAKATLDTFVGQAHAPSSEEDVLRAREREVTLPKLALQVAGSLLPHLALTKFRISAKISDSIGLPTREIIAGKYGEDVANDIYAGSVLHDILETTSLIPGGIVASMLLDTVVYAAEGNRKAAISTIAMAALFSVPSVKASVTTKVAAKEVKAAKYSELYAQLGGVNQVAVMRGQDAAAKAAEAIGYRMERAGVRGAQRMGREAGWAIRTGRVDASPALNSARVSTAERAATDLMARGAGGESTLTRAKRKWGEVTVDKPVDLYTGREDERIGSTDYARKRSWFPNTPDARNVGTEAERAAMRRAQGVMQSAQFVTQAKRLYRNLGTAVNIKPVAGSMKTVFEETALSQHKTVYVYEGRQLTGRVALTTNEEAIPILREMGISERGLSPNSTTIVPVANAAGIDTLPTPWMIAHAIFDGGTGNLLLKELPATKAIVDDVVAVFDDLRTGMNKEGYSVMPGGEYELDRFMKVKYGVPTQAEMTSQLAKNDQIRKQLETASGKDRARLEAELKKGAQVVARMDSNRLMADAAELATQPSRALGLSVNSRWGRNAREIVKQELEGVTTGTGSHGEMRYRAAPAVGQDVKQGQKLKSVADFQEFLKAKAKTQQDITTTAHYARRPQIDNVSEILAAALTKEEGYVPDLSHVLRDHPYRSQIEDAAKKIQKITADLPEAFAADTKGKVVWVAVN